MAGRKTLYTPETVKTIIEVIEAGGSDKDAAAYAGISEDSFARWQKAHADFAESVTRARAKGKVTRIARISKAGKTDWRADAWYLERRFPEEYAQTFIVKVTPEQAAILKRFNKTASQAFEELIQKLDAEAKAEK